MTYNSFFKDIIPIGNGNFKVSVRIPKHYGWIENVTIVLKDICHYRLEFAYEDEEYAYFEKDIHIETTAICHYYFSFSANGRNYIANRSGITDNLASTTINDCWKLTVNFKTPDWAKNGVMFHVFVDRFAKSEDTTIDEMPNRIIHYNWDEDPIVGPSFNGQWNIDFFGGNLKGIEEKLDYIKSLGTTILYLSPIVRSQSNHRYDMADYEQVDPYLGNNEDLRSLCEQAHKRGIYVVLDAVFNHTGNDSKYFNQYGTYDTLGAFQSTQSPYYPFYRKTMNGDFDYWWGMRNLPVCDGNSEIWKKYILGENGIIDQWFSLGIDGLRLDVADELTDEFIMGIRQAVHRNKPDGLIIGEVWKNPMRMNRNYLSSGLAMDSVMNYQLVDALIRYYKYCDIDKLKYVINMITTEYPDETINSLMNFSSTHDISRIIDILGCDCFNRYSEWSWNLQDSSIEFSKNHKMTDEEYSLGKKMLGSYICTIAFMPGILSVFYGDEIGLEGIGNLLNRRTYPWGNEDKELLEVFKKIGNLKKENTFLKTAKLNIIEVDESKIMYERYDSEESILVVANRKGENISISLPDKYRESEVLFKIDDCDKEHLSPFGAIVLKK